MPKDDREDLWTYSDIEAARASRRAAQLQQEAAERAERAAQRGGDPGEREDGHRRADLVAAAREAGIEPQFVEVALAELGSEEKALATTSPAIEIATTGWLGTRRRSVSAGRTMAAKGLLKANKPEL